MSATGTILRTAAQLYAYRGRHTGDHFAHTDGRIDETAAVYLAVTGHIPDVFHTDSDMAVLLITANQPAMDALRALSAVLPTPPPDSHGRPDDPIEHIAWWADHGTGHDDTPTTAEINGAFLRAANHADTADVVIPFPIPHPAT